MMVSDRSSTVLNIFNQPYPNAHRRLRAVVIDIPFYKNMFMQGHTVHEKCIEGLPDGSKYIGAITDFMQLSVYCIFEHESFVPVPNGGYIPVQPVRYEKVITE